ncbi:hypothetical protein LTR70_006312 [Exophiala xenobiotica]|uniref:GYF domain-containing protein n=1 Tax=Lithohypha guttulata TaxID=1690604 RepID=A0ABR0KHQ6_9EURO|nr:hypothetical protein LTR24_002371 [Lithohypha guttulata]KAK5316358.1 hypothetical protein LTR70_006312 [Exophiala xenobiotica]
MQSAKRSAEDFARVNHDSYGNGQPSKKARFDLRNPSALAPDALEEDATLDADVIGARGQQVKRGAVNVDGYDSDSDNENFDARAAAKTKVTEDAEKSKEADEGDMFADLEEDFKDGDDSEGDANRRGEGRKKDVRFLDEDEIEGQVKNSKSGGHVSADFALNGKGKAQDQEQESSSDSEVADEERAETGDLDEELGAGSKKMHAPKLDAFNMREENEEGKFDESGNYVRKAADPDAKHDLWLEGISKKEMKKASEAHERREKERRLKAIEDDAKSDGQILAMLIPQLQPSETVLEALARLNKGKTKRPKWQNKKKRKDSINDNDEEVKDENEDERSKAIEAITEAADLLLARGQPEVYDAEKELLVRQYKKATGEEWIEAQAAHSEEMVNDTESSQWQYRWSDARDGGDIHGPYDANTMKAWSDAGYFGEGVEFRKIDDSEWTRVPEFV